MTDRDKKDLITQVSVLRCDTKTQMDDTERRLIQHYRPLLNNALLGPPLESTAPSAPVYSHPPRGQHQRRVHITPSNPRYGLNLRMWLKRQPCWRGGTTR